MNKLFGNLAFSSLVGMGVLAAVAPSSSVHAGWDAQFNCVSTQSTTQLVDYFCDSGVLYQVNVNCLNLSTGEFGDGAGGWLRVETSVWAPAIGNWEFFVFQGTPNSSDAVCHLGGVYGESPKTEGRCTEAPDGSNKPGKPNKDAGYPEGNVRITSLGPSDLCD